MIFRKFYERKLKKLEAKYDAIIELHDMSEVQSMANHYFKELVDLQTEINLLKIKLAK